MVKTYKATVQFSSDRIKNIIKKEWQVLAGERSTMLLIFLLPFIILGEAILIIFLVANFGGETISVNPFFQRTLGKLASIIPAASNLGAEDQVRLLLLTQLNFYILLIPTMIAVYSASYSIVEEKVTRSLEPLLATPVRTSELLLAKALAGGIPAVLVTWVCAVVTVLVVCILGWGHLVGYAFGPAWIINMLLLTPEIALMSFLLGVIGSSRAKDFRSSQNFVLFIILPVMALIAVQLTGLVWFNAWGMLLVAAVVALADMLVLRIAVRLFRRESIIIEWR